MREYMITRNDEEQRFDKFLFKFLDRAPKGFIYKMLRKKNITLNGHKAEGKEILALDDVVRFFISDDTIANFTGNKTERSYHGHALSIIHENEDILLLNKPVGMLTQSDHSHCESISEYLVRYMLDQGILKKSELQTFRPSPCNRLDRNTSGIVMCGKSLKGLKYLSEEIKNRTIQKDYLALVHGEFSKSGICHAWYNKDTKKNQVAIYDHQVPESEEIITSFTPVSTKSGYTLVRAGLLTGKTHQIRAHLSFLGFPVVGDAKYGDEKINAAFRKEYHLTHQMLHSFSVTFPEGSYPDLSGHRYTAPIPDEALVILKSIGMGDPDEQS